MAIDWNREHEKFMRIAYARTMTAARKAFRSWPEWKIDDALAETTAKCWHTFQDCSCEDVTLSRCLQVSLSSQSSGLGMIERWHTGPELRTCTTTGLVSGGKTCQAKGKPPQATGATETIAS